VPPVGTGGGTHQPLPPGTILQGHYRIERVLGSGAFGRVYLATDTQDAAQPLRAIKELLDHQFASPADKREAIAWFKREVSTLLSLEHPGIPAIYGYWTAQASAGPFYLVMEYIPGKTLQQELQDAGGRVSWPQVVTWGLALGEVLAYLHSRTPPVIFRDIKPQNVLLDGRTKRPVLIDFGIARQLAQARGTRIGTPGCAPYEQWLGCAEPRSDLYALGALLHTLLTGRNPEAEYIRLRRSGLDVAGAIRALFPPADTLVPAVPAALAQVLVRATAFDKDDRYPDAAALVTALRALPLAAGPTTSSGGSPAGRMPTGSPSNGTDVPAVPAQAAPGFRLVGADPDQPSYTLPPRSVLTVGRDAANDIVITDATVSGRHAELRWEGRYWVVCDVGSTNGTYVSYGGAPGGERRVQRNALKEGSIVRFGEAAFRLEREPTP
jgi:serine/threonine protein kinase